MRSTRSESLVQSRGSMTCLRQKNRMGPSVSRSDHKTTEVVFVDKVTLFSVFRIWWMLGVVRKVWHFERMGWLLDRLFEGLSRLGLLCAEFRQIEHHVGQVRNEVEESEYVQLLSDARAIVARIRKEQLLENPVIKVMSREWETKKVVWYFGKRAEQEVRMECLRIGLVQWILGSQLKVDPAQCALLVERKQWLPYLMEYAQSRGIELVSYRQPLDVKKLMTACSRMLRILGRLISLSVRALKSRLWRVTRSVGVDGGRDKWRAEGRRSSSTVAIRYWFRKLSFDPSERSEFFWLAGSGIPYSEILLYDYVTDKPLDDKTLQEISARGIRLVGRGPGISPWLPTLRIVPVLVSLGAQLTLGIFSCLARRQPVSPYFVWALGVLALDYTYWYDFYATNRVRINVGTLNTSVGQVLALDSLNGVSAAYQYSVSPILCPTSLLSSGEDVQFVFSEAFEGLWRSVEAPVSNYVQTGFIYDAAVGAIRDLERVREIRKQLLNNGARYIVCFFDENSLDQWDFYANHEGAADDYEYLLKWLIEDRTLGILFKPKKSTNLFQRIARVSQLIDEAKKTGRCKFFKADTLTGNTFPAEAAMVADVCIGKLDGGTAALEARLAGVPTVLIDTEGFGSHPFYKWGKKRVVFESWESLRKVVERYRLTPQEYPEFGDWSPALDELDPYRDGQASLRMGLFISWIYEALKQGMEKNDAVALALQRFKERWGLTKDGAELQGRGAGSTVR